MVQSTRNCVVVLMRPYICGGREGKWLLILRDVMGQKVRNGKMPEEMGNWRGAEV